MGEVAMLFDEPQAGPSPEAIRIAEAVVFASSEPVEPAEIARRLPEGADVGAVLDEVRALYAARGVNLVKIAGKYAFRTAPDLTWILSREAPETRKLSRPALETLAIVAYHQPVTRAEIEDIRGVALSRGTLDVLLDTGWVRLRGRRKAPGRPVTYGTTEGFLAHFGLEKVGDLPGLEDLKGAGLFDGRLPPGFGVPSPDDSSILRQDEDPLDDPPTAAAEEIAAAPDEADDPREASDDPQDAREIDPNAD
ncbi:MAG: SMC-Scp complex subunit ScpB [Hyphomicrobiales bacterium]|nr:SMC-Scp complex subunit ScpB [Hyphomicrobiales bacterium]MDE2017111.1 SMC-Scp complex subunit ScpB [Hyphomicrobiales bacterium]